MRLPCTFSVPTPESDNFLWNLGTFYWQMAVRNQNLNAICAHWYWGAIAPRSLLLIVSNKTKYMYAHTWDWALMYLFLSIHLLKTLNSYWYLWFSLLIFLICNFFLQHWEFRNLALIFQDIFNYFFNPKSIRHIVGSWVCGLFSFPALVAKDINLSPVNGKFDHLSPHSKAFIL